MNPAKPPMEFPQILQQVTRLLGKHLGVDPVYIKPEDNIANTMDSISVIEFVLGLEEFFQLEIPDEVMEGAKTVEDIARRVEEQLLAQGRVADHVTKPPIDLNEIGPVGGEPGPPPPCGTCGETATTLLYHGFDEPDPRCEKHASLATPYPLDSQTQELIELFRSATIENHPTISEQWAKLILDKYKLIPR
jgi:acyl carrier protein